MIWIYGFVANCSVRTQSEPIPVVAVKGSRKSLLITVENMHVWTSMRTKNSVCQNRQGDYKCICDSGFKSELCLDVDECSMNKTMCDGNADCLNTPGNFECACRKGFFGTGSECEKGQCQDSVCAGNKKCKSLTTIGFVCKAKIGKETKNQLVLDS